MTVLPPALPGTALRIFATSDLGASTVPLRTSYGESGTCAGLLELLEREPQPTVWLEVGDLVVGNPSYPLLGERPWDEVADLPIAAAAAGNHEFDDGVDALLTAAERLSFPLLCANVDVGLAPTALVETGAGPVGVIGLTHPHVDDLTSAPAPDTDWPQRVGPLARDLRRDGARLVVALLHDGVEWWPAAPIATRARRLEELARPWAGEVDLIVAGHNFGTWTGAIGGTPTGEPHLFASSVLVVDVIDRAMIRGVFRVPPKRPVHASPATEAIDAAATRIVGELPETWLTRTGAPHYLPDLIARALQSATGADAGFVLPGFHGIQAPFDGAIAALGGGPVSELDVVRLVADPDYVPRVAELRPGELRVAAEAYARTADPHNALGDRLAWNWCRMPAGISSVRKEPTTVAMFPGVVPRVSTWLGRDVATAPAGISAVDALVGALS